nr:hypothetical protein [Tanacetum cinerariifolium]
LASTSLGGDTTVKAALTIFKASQDAHASSDAGHDADEVPDTTTMPFRCTRTKRRWLGKTFTSSAFEHFQENISAIEDTIPAGAGIPADAQTIPAGSTPISTIGGVFAGSFMDPTGQAAAVAPSLSAIPAADKGKDPMVDDSILADLLTEQEQLLGDDVNEDNMNERLGMLLMRKRRELAEQSRCTVHYGEICTGCIEDGPHMPLLAPMLVVPAGGDGADTAAAGAAATNEVPPPPPPPDVPPIHTSSSTPGPFTAAQDTPVRDPTPMREPTPDSVALTDLSLKLDRCINRVTTLENELGVTKKVLGGVVLKLVSRVKRLEGILNQRKRRMVLSDSEGEEAATKEQEFDLDALHELASMSLGGDTTVKAALTIFKASQDAHASSDAGHDADEVPDTTTMPFRCTRTKRRWLGKTFTSSAFEHFQENISAIEDTIPAGVGIPADAQTIPAGSTPISTIGGKAPMVDDSILADLLTEQEQVLKILHDYQLGEDLAKKLQAEQEAEFARQQEELAQKAQAKSLLGDDVNEDNMNERLGMLLMRKRRELAEQSRVPASVPTAPSIVVDVSVSVVSTTTADVSVSELPIPTNGSIGVSTGVIEATTTSIPNPPPPSSSRRRRKQIAKKRVTPIVDVADVELINFDSDGESDGDPSPYAPYVGWEMRTTFRPTPTLDAPSAKRARQGVPQVPAASSQVPASVPAAPSIVVDVSVSVVSTTTADVSVSELPISTNGFIGVLTGTVDGRVIYMFVNVSYPLSEATLERMLKHGLEVPKLLVGGDLTMAEQLVHFIKATLLNAQSTV